MSHELQEGVKLHFIQLVPIETGGTCALTVGDNIQSITVTEQPGQMGMVPWARVVKDDGSAMLVNLANVESVGLESES